MNKSNFITKISQEDVKKIWFSSDHHFFHKNIIKYCNRPFETVEEMNEKLVENWNSVVGPDDHVYHLGDFCFGNVEKWNWCLEGYPYPNRLNGHIHLILGNHDPDRVFRPGTLIERFDSIEFQKVLVIEGWTVYLNHFPFASFSNNYDHKVIQLLGHIHSGPDGIGNVMLGGNKLQWNQYDVGVDNNAYTPVSWAQVKERMHLEENLTREWEETMEKMKLIEKK
jgi:calcineurin-like phosphoesterase family protein